MTVDRHDLSADSIADVQRHLRQFAQTYPELGLYQRLCEAAAGDDEVSGLLLAARPGQARPVLLLAAIHDFVLAHPESAAARWYPSVTTPPAHGDPWPDVRATVLANADALREVIATHTTQTNEVNRCAYLAPLLALGAADEPTRPVALVELGASAGLLLHVDCFDTRLGSTRFGDLGSEVHCAGELRGARAVSPALPPVVARHGLDLHPVDLVDSDAVRWLEACLWPDVPGRLERFRAAVRHARRHPVQLHRGSMVEDLPLLLARIDAELPAEVGIVVLDSWALTYVATPERRTVADAIAAAGVHRSVTWVSAEPPGAVPGVGLPAGAAGRDDTTVLGSQRWRRGGPAGRRAIGTAHAHGAWVDLSGA